ncbi:hypothetical protein KRX51_01775 [Corynebacterium sp. TAE3-ERU12]|uniref:hypothetical protein n=1 Tax=Corynebacterium sp. TAE3-ERU12 TaxID=2849491 RepID=UPI001C45BD6A|nr:hypothetical protein [Corynebacterium sp. TAE3-ERU12]MBV7294646.1 hypothetical protein [Corynebacterium sp. TAE3-ERU12]
MSEFAQNEATNFEEESPRAIRRRERAQRRAERRAARGDKGKIAWPVVLMAGGASAVVSSLVVSVGVVATAARDAGPDPQAMSMLVQQVSERSAGPGEAPANRSAARSSDRGRATSGNRRSNSSANNKRGSVRQASARPSNRSSGSSSRSSGRPSRPSPSRGGRPPAPPVNNPGGNGPGGGIAGGIDNIPVIGDIVALIKGLIDLIQNGIADGGKPGGDAPGNNGGGNGPGPFGSSGRETQPTQAELAAVLEDGEEGIPAFTRVVSCLNDLEVPIEDPSDNAAPLPLPNLFANPEAVNGADILRIIVTEITTEGKLSSQTLAELDERSEALCR